MRIYLLMIRDRQFKDAAAMAVANLLPERVVYFATNRAIAHYSTHEGSHGEVPTIAAIDVLKAYGS